jgi:hypothetical protein
MERAGVAIPGGASQQSMQQQQQQPHSDSEDEGVSPTTGTYSKPTEKSMLFNAVMLAIRVLICEASRSTRKCTLSHKKHRCAFTAHVHSALQK